MKAILSELGFAFNATDYINLYGNEMLLKLQRKYTIRTVDRTTKIPQVTKLYQLIKAPNCKIIEFPRFAMKELMSNTPSAKSPISDVDIQLPIPEQIETVQYIGKSNPNQQIVVNHIVNNIFQNAEVTGTTLKLAAGVGKSFVAKDIIGRMKLKTLVVVPNTYLLDQWVGLLQQYFPTTKVGTLYGNRKTDGDIIVGIINTMAELQSFEVKEKKPWPNVGNTLKYVNVAKTIQVDDILQNVGLTIFDESQIVKLACNITMSTSMPFYTEFGLIRSVDGRLQLIKTTERNLAHDDLDYLVSKFNDIRSTEIAEQVAQVFKDRFGSIALCCQLSDCESKFLTILDYLETNEEFKNHIGNHYLKQAFTKYGFKRASECDKGALYKIYCDNPMNDGFAIDEFE